MRYGSADERKKELDEIVKAAKYTLEKLSDERLKKLEDNETKLALLELKDFLKGFTGATYWTDEEVQTNSVYLDGVLTGVQMLSGSSPEKRSCTKTCRDEQDECDQRANNYRAHLRCAIYAIACMADCILD